MKSRVRLPAEALRIVEQALASSRGLVLLIGMNGSGVEDALEALAADLAQSGRKISGVFGDGVWSEEEKIPAWPSGSDLSVIDAKTGATYADEIKKLESKKIDALFIDQIRDRATAESAIGFAQHRALTIGALRGSDAFSAIEGMLSFGIPRAQLLSVLRLVVASTRTAPNQVSFEVMGPELKPIRPFA